MRNVRVVFEGRNKSLSEMLLGYSKLICHLIFEIKLSENFQRKVRFVADGHKYLVNLHSYIQLLFSVIQYVFFSYSQLWTKLRYYLAIYRVYIYQRHVDRSSIMLLVMILVRKRIMYLFSGEPCTAYKPVVLLLEPFSRNHFVILDLNHTIWLIPTCGFESIVKIMVISITNIFLCMLIIFF